MKAVARRKSSIQNPVQTTSEGSDSGFRVGDYPEEFKQKMVALLLLPDGPSANALSKQTGVSQPTLSRWLREAKARSAPTVVKAEGEQNIFIIVPRGVERKELEEALSTVRMVLVNQ